MKNKQGGGERDLLERVMHNRFFRGTALFVRRYFDHRVARDSAALTYYLLFAMFPLLIFLSNLVGFCADYFHFSAILTDGFIELWSTLRFVFLGCIVFLALAVLYGLAQETRSVHYVWPGVLFSLTAWMVLSLLFSLYVENAANYSVIYGSIGAIIVLLLWLYLSATMMIMGAEFNSVLMEMKTARG